MEGIDQYILQQMQNPNKLKRVKMENWKKSQPRPTPDSIVPWEIYSKSLYSEQDVIKTFKRLEGKFLITSFIRGKKDEKIIWYKLNKEN